MVRYSKLERAGLRDEISLARDQIDREWKKETPSPSIIENLRRHIDYCQEQLKE